MCVCLRLRACACACACNKACVYARVCMYAYMHVCVFIQKKTPSVIVINTEIKRNYFRAAVFENDSRFFPKTHKAFKTQTVRKIIICVLNANINRLFN